MLRITKQTDYGIVLLTHMAANPERLVNAPELAGEASLPQPMVAKTLKLLARSGILESHRGVNGGYCLARPPEELSVAEVIGALEGQIAITECTDDTPGLCAQEKVCPVRSNWNRINLAIQEALERISLAEMTGPVRVPRPAELVQLGSCGATGGCGRPSAGSGSSAEAV
jgi:FeS assembly SUF system regulator